MHVEHSTDLYSIELRNMVYDFAIINLRNTSIRHSSSSPQSKPSSRQIPKRIRTVTSDKLVIPYVGLTQTCRTLRWEFRDRWLSNLTILTWAIQVYVFAFIERLKTPLLRAFNGLPLNLLRIEILDTKVDGEVDLLSLALLKEKRPKLDISIVLQNQGEVPSNALMRLLENKEKDWLRGITGGGITHIRVSIHNERH